MTTVGILYGKSSVCLSVTLRYHDHMGWNSSQIILWLISWWMVFTLCRPQHQGSTLRGTTHNFDRNKGGYAKSGLQSIKYCVSETGQGRTEVTIKDQWEVACAFDQCQNQW